MSKTYEVETKTVEYADMRVYVEAESFADAEFRVLSNQWSLVDEINPLSLEIDEVTRITEVVA